jgi:hypothetical protein
LHALCIIQNFNETLFCFSRNQQFKSENEIARKPSKISRQKVRLQKSGGDKSLYLKISLLSTLVYKNLHGHIVTKKPAKEGFLKLSITILTVTAFNKVTNGHNW